MRRTRTRNPEFDAAAEERIERAVAHFQSVADTALEELSVPSERYERYFDRFLTYLEDNKDAIAEQARELLKRKESDFAGIDDATLSEAVSDPTIYQVTVSDADVDDMPSDVVWRVSVGPQVTTTDPQALEDLVLDHFSFDEFVETLSRLSERKIDVEFSLTFQKVVRSPFLLRAYAQPQTLDDTDVRLLERCREDWPDFILSDEVFVITRAGALWGMQARISRVGLVDKLRELIEGRKASARPDEVVYRYAGTNDTVAGASARGFYVASLRPDQLKAEGAALGICVGRNDMGYARKLRAGDIQIFSIRTEAGESKFCIERYVAPGKIAQVKGTANRLPGFEPGQTTLTKPDDVRLVVEFLQAWGYSDEAIATMNDIGPGVRTMLENGINPFIPPPKRQRPVLSPEEREARRLAAMRRRAAENPGLRPSPATAAMIREDYAHPWGGRWGA